MPELPDLEVYRRALTERLCPDRDSAERLEFVELRTPFLLRSTEPPLTELFGSTLRSVSRLGKQLCFHFDDELVAVLHLMIAGRLRFRTGGSPPRLGPKTLCARFAFGPGDLWISEASPKKRASLRLVRGAEALRELDRGGLEALDSDPRELATRLRSENRTLKRALTDPRLLAGIGNAYSDEILWRARLSPLTRTQNLDDDDFVGIHRAIVETLQEWTERLDRQREGAFPEKVTAFRPEMNAHGRFGLPCHGCGSKIQRIRYASNEANYCPTCQTGGTLLRDRSLSLLLKDDWPKSLEELEERPEP